MDAVDPHYSMQLKGEESGGEWSLCPQKYEIGYIFAKLMFFLPKRPPRVFLRKDVASGAALFGVVLFCLGFFYENRMASLQSNDLGFEF